MFLCNITTTNNLTVEELSTCNTSNKIQIYRNEQENKKYLLEKIRENQELICLEAEIIEHS